ncbi:MAG: ATP-binding cassette domain-containing protein, partial [Syntrophomonas sp.]
EALKELSLVIRDGEKLGIIGATGSGKSTLLYLLNALLRPAKGKVFLDGKDTANFKKADLLELRQKVGLVFQYPEQQIFEEYVYEEVAFGPRNLGLDEAEVKNRVENALSRVGLPPQIFVRRDTASLSGGQKRRLALAGILGMGPRYLLLDEPTAGLDYEGRFVLLDYLIRLNLEQRTTIVMVSHNLAELLHVCDRIVLLNDGRIGIDVDAKLLLKYYEQIKELGFEPTKSLEVIAGLNRRNWGIDTSPKTPEEAGYLIAEKLKTRT